ncbi:hypothetical protein [Pseudomonas putida]
MKLTAYQGQIVKYLSANIPVDEFDALEANVEGGAHTLVIAHAPLTDFGGEETVVVLLPPASGNVILGITESRVDIAALTLANLYDYQLKRFVKLRIGEVLVMPKDGTDDPLSLEVPHAVLLLRIDTSISLAKLPDNFSFSDGDASFLLAVPLDENEYLFRKANGHDALLDRFRNEGKLIYF